MNFFLLQNVPLDSFDNRIEIFSLTVRKFLAQNPGQVYDFLIFSEKVFS